MIRIYNKDNECKYGDGIKDWEFELLLQLTITINWAKKDTLWLSGGSRGEARGPPLILGKIGEITDGRKAGRASKTKPGPHLSSRSGSATVSVQLRKQGDHSGSSKDLLIYCLLHQLITNQQFTDGYFVHIGSDVKGGSRAVSSDVYVAFGMFKKNLKHQTVL